MDRKLFILIIVVVWINVIAAIDRETDAAQDTFKRNLIEGESIQVDEERFLQKLSNLLKKKEITHLAATIDRPAAKQLKRTISSPSFRNHIANLENNPELMRAMQKSPAAHQVKTLMRQHSIKITPRQATHIRKLDVEGKDTIVGIIYSLGFLGLLAAAVGILIYSTVASGK